MMQLTQCDVTRPAMIAEIMPLFKLHARIENTDEDVLLARYIGAAISAAENYLMRDVWPTVRTWEGTLTMFSGYPPPVYPLGALLPPQPFIVRRGRARTLTITDADDVAVPVDQYAVIMSADPKTWGFQIAPAAELNGVTVVAETGFADFASMPDDLQQFILVAAGAMYEVRELANYGGGSAGVTTAAFLPLYLLDTWANLTYA